MEDIQRDQAIKEAGSDSSASSGGAPTNNRKKEELITLQHFLKFTCFDRIILSSNDDTNDEKPHRIRLLSWNIDGLDPKDQAARTTGICESILRDDPHVVFLQEVISATQSILSEQLPMYHVIPGNIFRGYYTVILVKKGFANITEIKIIDLPTQMGRNLLFVKCTIKGEEFCLMTTHLESTMPGAQNRRKQLTKAFTLMGQFDKDSTVIFGGDLNLRDKEVLQVGGLPENVFDIWEISGKREDARFTWDFKYNDNIPRKRSSGSTPRFPFDRLYFKYSEPRKVEPVYFQLIGFDRLKSCHRFCSDHWGLLTHLDIVV